MTEPTRILARGTLRYYDNKGNALSSPVFVIEWTPSRGDDLTGSAILVFLDDGRDNREYPHAKGQIRQITLWYESAELTIDTATFVGAEPATTLDAKVEEFQRWVQEGIDRRGR